MAIQRQHPNSLCGFDQFLFAVYCIIKSVKTKRPRLPSHFGPLEASRCAYAESPC
jgi:hypothetical protein